MKLGSIEMDSARHLVNIKRSLKSNLDASDNSAEEEALIEDGAGAGPFSSSIWPPRSYLCNFCGREFRSAQALGGHMNVHRRDRARLKQIPSHQNEFLHHHQYQNQHYPIQNLCKFGEFEHPYTVPYNPKLISDTRVVSPVSASTPRSKENCLKPDMEGNVFVDPEMEENISRKRRRTNELELPFFSKPDCINKHHLQAEVMGLFPNATEVLDLELRLGIPAYV